MDPWTLLCLDQKSSSFQVALWLYCGSRFYASNRKKKRTNPQEMDVFTGYLVLRITSDFRRGLSQAAGERGESLSVFFAGCMLKCVVYGWRFLKHRMTAPRGRAPGLYLLCIGGGVAMDHAYLVQWNKHWYVLLRKQKYIFFLPL